MKAHSAWPYRYGKYLGVVELVDVRQLFATRRFAHPHRRVGIGRTDGQVLRHPLDEPQGQRERADGSRADVGPGDVVLERVHQLVPEHVIARLDWTGKRQHDPALVGFGHAAGTLAELTHDGVGLPKVRTAGVKDECLASAQLVVEQLRQPRVPPLGHPGRHARRLFLFGVVVDVKVIGLQNFEVELAVLHLVAAEVATLGECRT